MFTSAQETIEKWMKDGDTKEEAIARLESILHCKLPEIVINTVREKDNETN